MFQGFTFLSRGRQSVGGRSDAEYKIVQVLLL